MIHHTYGSTGVEVSALGFGGMRFAEWDNSEKCAELVKAAYDRGITYFDTAPGYGGGKSEEHFGRAFKEMLKTRRDKPFYVSTKSNQSDPDDIRRDLETSLTRMGLDHIDFYHMWWVVRKQWYYDRKAAGALECFAKLKEEGLVRHICISSHMSGTEIEEVLNDFPFEGVLLGYSAMNFPFRERALDVASESGRGVVVMNPLAGGMIPKHPEHFQFLKTREDESVVEAALRFLWTDTRITVALVGFSVMDHLDEALRAMDDHEPLPASEIERIRSSLGSELDTLCTGCGYCDECPQGVDVPRLMQSYNQLLMTRDPKALIGTMKYGYGVYPDHGIENCVECKQCEEACTQKLPIVERLQHIRREVERALEEEKKG